MRSTRRVMVCGASRGIDAGVAEHFAKLGDEVLSVSRTPSAVGTWIQADLATAEGLNSATAAVGDGSLDGLLYMGGIWEDGAFTESYDFHACGDDVTERLLAVNLMAPIKLAHRLANALSNSGSPRIVMIGSTSGLDNRGGPEVANTASKFGLRAAAEALQMVLGPNGVGVTVINPANVGTPEVMDDIARGDFGAQQPIPLDDVVAAVDFAMTLSPASVATTITLDQIDPG